MSWLLYTVLQWKLGCTWLFGSCFSPDLCPRVGMQGHMVALFLVFKETFIHFSIVAVSIYIPTNSIGGCPSLHTVEPLLISERQEQIINASLFRLHFAKLLRWSCENPGSIRGPLDPVLAFVSLFHSHPSLLLPGVRLTKCKFLSEALLLGEPKQNRKEKKRS